MRLNQNILGIVSLLVVIFFLAFGFLYLISKNGSNSYGIKRIQDSQILRLVLSLIAILLAWVFPWISLKILFSLSSVLFLISLFPLKKSSFGIIALVLLFIISIVITGGIIIDNIPKNIGKIISDTTFWENFNFDSNQIIFSTDKKMEVDRFSKIFIDVPTKVDIEFIEDDNTIYFPSKLKTRINDGKLVLFSEDKIKSNTVYQIKLGTESLRDVKISCAGLKINGTGKFKNLEVDSAGSYIKGNIEATEDIDIECSGLELSADFKGNSLTVNCAGANISSQFIVNKIKINSTGLNLKTKAKFKSFEINATGLNGAIDIVNSENEEGLLCVDATGGNLTIKNPNNASIYTQTSGFIKLTRE
uniref:Adhesin domain-containing protein n=1 Tax=Caldicellulosiruptor owensensis TaxID=55205 RepID=A0A7C5V2M1_9FIRM